MAPGEQESEYWGNTLALVGRLRPGVMPAEAQAELDVLVPQIMAAHEESLDPEMYLPAWQATPEGAELVVRTGLAPQTLRPSLMKTPRALNPSQADTQLRPLQHIVNRSVSPRRFLALLVGTFAALGLVLASLGIFGVVSYSVTQRTQEIGIRMALGARASQVQLHVMAHGLRLAGLGVGLGMLASFATARWIASLLFGTPPADPATFLGSASSPSRWCWPRDRGWRVAPRGWTRS